jgi:hypothetical protein
VTVFCKAVVFVTIVKVLLLWPVSHMVMRYHSLGTTNSGLKNIIIAPSVLADVNVDVFYGICLLSLIVVFFIRWNYISAILFCWLIINLNRVNFLLNNGGDFVLVLLAVWMIGMVSAQPFKNEKLKVIQVSVFNFAVLMAQVQIVLIYFVSGWDKIGSVLWRSGEAFAYTAHLDFMFNPLFVNFLTSDFTNAILSWITIAFELLFVVFVWFKRTRLIFLAIGTLFHLIIGMALSLPDFAGIMIVSYLIFLKDSDYNYLKSRLTRLPL